MNDIPIHPSSMNFSPTSTNSSIGGGSSPTQSWGGSGPNTPQLQPTNPIAPWKPANSLLSLPPSPPDALPGAFTLDVDSTKKNPWNAEPQAPKARMCHRDVTMKWEIQTPTSDSTPTTPLIGAPRASEPTTPLASNTPPATPQLGPTARFGHTSVVDVSNIDGPTMIMFGGRDSSAYNNDVWSFNLNENRWTRHACEDEQEQPPLLMPPLPVGNNNDQQGGAAASGNSDSSGNGSGSKLKPSARAGHTAIVTSDRKMIVFGGAIDNTTNCNDVWELDLVTMKWSKKDTFANDQGTQLVPAPRKGHTAVEHDGSMVVFGGELNNDNRVWKYTPSTKITPLDDEETYVVHGESSAPQEAAAVSTDGEWTVIETSGDAPPPRQYHTAELDKDKDSMLVFGGRGKGSFLNDLHELNLDTNVWRKIEGAGAVPSSRMCASSVFQNGTLCIFSGGATSYYADCYEFDRETESWRRLSQGPVACTRPTTVFHDNQITMFGGCTSSQKFLGDVIKLQVEAPSLKEVCRQWIRGAKKKIDASQVPAHLRHYLASAE